MLGVAEMENIQAATPSTLVKFRIRNAFEEIELKTESSFDASLTSLELQVDFPGGVGNRWLYF
jgi:hypothetical protein